MIFNELCAAMQDLAQIKNTLFIGQGVGCAGHR